jgi:CO/xanthine dehydrogenase Mo-binding subunit
MGVAIMEGYDTYVAVVAEVSVGADGEVKVVKTTVAADMGMIVNPEIVEQQIQSSIIMGMGHGAEAFHHREKWQLLNKPTSTPTLWFVPTNLP